MTATEINAYIVGLSDEVLIRAADEAHADLKKAADEQPNSEWHEACFAALYVFCEEMGRRGLKRQMPNTEAREPGPKTNT